MKILFAMNEFVPSVGGAMGVAGDEIASLAKLGHEIVIVSGTAGDSWQGIPMRTIPVKDAKWAFKSYVGLRNPRVERAFEAILIEEKPDVVHFHNLYFQYPFSLIKIARTHCRKVFFTAHDAMSMSPNKLFHFVSSKAGPVDPNDYHLSLYEEWRQNKKAFNPFRRFFIRQYLRSATRIFAVSYELKKAMNANGIHNIEVLHNALDPQKYSYDKTTALALRDKLGLKDKKVILVAGRLSVLKGGIAAIEILNEVKRSVPEAVLLALTDKENSDVMKGRAKELGIADSIVSVQSVPRDQIQNYYGLSDVVMMPSLCLDTFGMVPLEAMACSKPVVVTTFGGAREMVEEGKNGYVANPLRAAEFAAPIIGILSNSNKAEAMGKRSREIVEERFTLKEHVSKLLSLYMTVS